MLDAKWENFDKKQLEEELTRMLRQLKDNLSPVALDLFVDYVCIISRLRSMEEYSDSKLGHCDGE